MDVINQSVSQELALNVLPRRPRTGLWLIFYVCTSIYDRLDIVFAYNGLCELLVIFFGGGIFEILNFQKNHLVLEYFIELCFFPK